MPTPLVIVTSSDLAAELYENSLSSPIKLTTVTAVPTTVPPFLYSVAPKVSIAAAES